MSGNRSEERLAAALEASIANLKRGDLDGMEARLTEIERAASRLDQRKLTDATARRLSDLLERHRNLANGARAGLRQALRRIAALKGDADPMTGYDANGERTEIGQKSGQFEQKV